MLTPANTPKCWITQAGGVLVETRERKEDKGKWIEMVSVGWGRGGDLCTGKYRTLTAKRATCIGNITLQNVTSTPKR